ncbi:MAG: hypothetical protein WBB19_13255 [Desulforhopalus sp.]
MVSYKKTFITCVLIVSLLGYSFSALAEPAESAFEVVQNGPEFMAIDLVLVRPLGLVALLAGTVVFVVALPFSALGGNTGETWNALVAEPAEYTFSRPLGYYEEQSQPTTLQPDVR